MSETNDKHLDLEELIAMAKEDPEAGLAIMENDLRRDLAAQFSALRDARGLSVRDFAAEMGTSKSQVQRVLHEDYGGNLTLRTICRAAQVVDADVDIRLRARDVAPMRGKLLDLLSPKTGGAAAIKRVGFTPKGEWKEGPPAKLRSVG